MFLYDSQYVESLGYLMAGLGFFSMSIYCLLQICSVTYFIALVHNTDVSQAGLFGSGGVRA